MDKFVDLKDRAVSVTSQTGWLGKQDIVTDFFSQPDPSPLTFAASLNFQTLAEADKLNTTQKFTSLFTSLMSRDVLENDKKFSDIWNPLSIYKKMELCEMCDEASGETLLIRAARYAPHRPHIIRLLRYYSNPEACDKLGNKYYHHIRKTPVTDADTKLLFTKNEVPSIAEERRGSELSRIISLGRRLVFDNKADTIPESTTQAISASQTAALDKFVGK